MESNLNLVICPFKQICNLMKYKPRNGNVGPISKTGNEFWKGKTLSNVCDS